MAQTKNFNVKSDPKLACTCGHPECDKREVSIIALVRLQSLRESVNRPLTVTSGGELFFQHMKAQLDVFCENIAIGLIDK